MIGEVASALVLTSASDMSVFWSLGKLNAGPISLLGATAWIKAQLFG